MTIVVRNYNPGPISVCINHWGDEGDTGAYTIAKGASESWNRDTETNVVMTLGPIGSTTASYLIAGPGTVYVYYTFQSGTTVYDDYGQKLPDLNKRFV